NKSNDERADHVHDDRAPWKRFAEQPRGDARAPVTRYPSERASDRDPDIGGHWSICSAGMAAGGACTRKRALAIRPRIASRPAMATAAKAAPAKNVPRGPIVSQRPPAMTLAARSAIPPSRLNMP